MKLPTYPLIVGWRCKQCKRLGTASALVGQDIQRQVEIAHSAAVRRTWRQGFCDGDQIRWTPQELTRRVPA